MSRSRSALVALIGLVVGVLLGLLRRRPGTLALPQDEPAGGAGASTST